MKQLPATLSWDRFFYPAASGFWVLTIVTIVLMGYRGSYFSEGVSFIIRDGHCTLGVNGFGEHCFGDFAYPYYSPGGGYSEHDLVAVETPFVLHFFLLLSRLPFNFALAIQTAFSAAAILIPLSHTLRRTKRNEAKFIGPFLFLSSTGMISAFDRGNRVVWVIPFVYFGFLAWRRDKWQVVFWCVIAAGMIKWWGILLALLLVSSKRKHLALFAVIATGVTHFFCLLSINFILEVLLIPGNLSSRIGDLASDISNSNYADAVSGRSVAASDFVGRLACWVSGSPACGPPRSFLPVDPNLFHGVLSIGLFVIWLGCAGRRGKADQKVTVLFFALMVVVIPQSAIYNLSLLSVAFLIIWSDLETDRLGTTVRGRDENAERLPTEREATWAVALAASIVPVPFLVYPSGRIFPIQIEGIEVLKWSMLLPGVWLIVFGMEARVLVSGQIRRASRHSTDLDKDSSPME